MRKRQCIGCRTEIKSPMLACRTCWGRLPSTIRRRVESTDPKKYIPGAVDAVKWFKDHP